MTDRPRATVLVVDDEDYVRESISALLSERGFRVRTAGSVRAALEPSALAGTDIVVTDLKMPGESGLDLVREIGARNGPPVIVLTAYGTVQSAVECVRAGAADYLLKPTNPDEVSLVVDRVLSRSVERRELAFLRSRAGSLPERPEPIGESPGWKQVVELARVAATADTTVLLLGETGTGKEEVARLVHGRSGRAERPFVAVNCAAVPETLFESEFFGHRKGAFTGAVSDRDGRFRIAHGGTLLLDEVDALSPASQAKVLRVLESSSFERVGDSEPTLVDVRLICATNSNLEQRVEDGDFRRDLFYRIRVLEIVIPPLRERIEDIELLARAFTREFAARLGKTVVAPSDEVVAVLRGYAWPGNVRELRNVIERAVLLEKGDELQVESLPMLTGARTVSPSATNLREALAAEERRLLERALEQASGVKRDAAKALGIDERNMAYYLRKHGLIE
ncbi:MAG: sigma-54 dependent transcriptional regulator [Acidobacteriota bacterium]